MNKKNWINLVCEINSRIDFLVHFLQKILKFLIFFDTDNTLNKNNMRCYLFENAFVFNLK